MKKYPHDVMPDYWPPFTRTQPCNPVPTNGPFNLSRPCYDESKGVQTNFYGWRIPSYVAPQILNCQNPDSGYLSEPKANANLAGMNLGRCDRDQLRLTDLQWRYMYGAGSSEQACEILGGVSRSLATADSATKRGHFDKAQYFIQQAAALARRELQGKDLEGAMSYVGDAQDRLDVRIQADLEGDQFFAERQEQMAEDSLAQAEAQRQEQLAKERAAWTAEDQRRDDEATKWAQRGDWWGRMKYAFSSLPGGHSAMASLPTEAPTIPDPAKRVAMVAGLALAGYVGFQVFVAGKAIKKTLF